MKSLLNLFYNKYNKDTICVASCEESISYIYILLTLLRHLKRRLKSQSYLEDLIKQILNVDNEALKVRNIYSCPLMLVAPQILERSGVEADSRDGSRRQFQQELKS
jgi:hypothetical protein